MTKSLQMRLDSLKTLAEKKQKPAKKANKTRNQYRDELAGISLVDALGGFDYGTPRATDTSFYDFDCALAARVTHSETDIDENF